MEKNHERRISMSTSGEDATPWEAVYLHIGVVSLSCELGDKKLKDFLQNA
jgi:hypothetical protein